MATATSSSLRRTSALLELALELEQDPAEVRATFERLIRTTDHLATLSERLLTLATPHEALSSDRGASLAQIVEGLLERRSAEDAARLTIVTGEGDGLVRGDEVLLAAMVDNVVDNVVDNALKFSTSLVRVSVLEDHDEVVVEVADEGPGIPDELARELFEPFRRAAGQREPGRGLGLALVEHIATAYGGRAEFVGARARGAAVAIRLPLAGR